MAKFEVVERFAAADIKLPQRSTTGSAGYDFEVAENIIIPSHAKLCNKMLNAFWDPPSLVDLDTMASITKGSSAKPTLVPTGVKCKLDPDTYLEITVRSSCPLKYWLILANGEGIIDADYYGNNDSDGEIFFQMINLSPFDIELHKGDKIGQGIIKSYLLTEDDAAIGERVGGFGSTDV